MRRVFVKLWRGEIALVRMFWVAHVAVWLGSVFLFQLLSVSINMAVKPVVGVPLGLLFVLYNIIGVIRSARRADRGLLRIVAPLISLLLVMLSLWVPVYFSGRPIFIISM